MLVQFIFYVIFYQFFTISLTTLKEMNCSKLTWKSREYKAITYSTSAISCGRVVSERHYYDGYDRKVNGSTPTQASLLRPWIRCFTIIISAWCNLASIKLKKSEAKFNPENSETRATRERVWIRRMHRASVTFSSQEDKNEKVRYRSFRKFLRYELTFQI